MKETGYFGTPKPNVYSFKWGRIGWSAGATTYSNTKPIGSLPIATPGPYSLPTYSSVWNSCSIGETVKANIDATEAAELVRCVGNSVMQVTGTGGGGDWWVGTLWGATSDALYRPIDIRDTVPSGEYIYNNSSAPYSFQNPFKSLFSSAGGYANLQKLDPAFTGGGQMYYFYNRTQHTETYAAMGARMLGYSAKAQRFGLPMWNNTAAQEKFTGSTVGTLLTAQSTGSKYAGTISTSHPTNSGLNLAPTITSGPSVSGNISDVTSVIIAWGTNYPATTMIDDNATYNDTVLNTSHSATLSGLSIGTYNYNAISYDCVANKAQSAATFILADVNVMPTTLNTKSKGDYVTAVIKLPAGYDCTMVDISTVKLQGTLPVVAVSGSCTTVDDRATVKFNRAAVAGIVSPGSNIMVVEGSTFGGTPIVGYSIMNVQ